MRIVIAFVCALACSACMQETVRFEAKPSQQAMTRDGQPALISQKKSTLVMIRPARRRFSSGDRPVFVVAIHNLTKAPLDFHVRDVAVTQVAGETSVAMKVFSYEDLVAEEESRQVMTALLVGAAAGANAAVASQAGYRTRTTTVNAPGGSYSYQTTTRNPSASVAALNRATRQNQRLINAAVRDGQSALAALERDTIKDNTLMPNEWYGGLLHVQAPDEAAGAGGPKRYVIAMTIGTERHEFDVVQEGVK
jgi:hypothetical protein